MSPQRTGASSDARSILSAARRLRADGTPFLCATVVSVRGSSYRRPGARLLATPERHVAGCVSGGCLEKDLLRTSWWRTERGPVVVRYDSADSESPQAALGCGGEVDILLERANTGRPADPMTLVERALASDRVAALATVYRSSARSVPVGARFCLIDEELACSEPEAPGERVAHAIRAACEGARTSRLASSFSHAGDADGPTDGGSFDALVEAVVPPPHLFVFGAGHDALPVAESAQRLGWSVTLWEPSARIDTRARFAATDASLVAGDLSEVRRAVDACDRALALVMGHDTRHDRAAFAMLLGSRARYVGVLGPRHRTETLAAEPGDLADPRVHAPVGLDLGAETPEEIALSITAEMLAHVRRTGSAPLRTLPSIHGAERDP